MSIAIEVSSVDRATPAAKALYEQLKPEHLASAVGPACTRHVQRRLRANGTNKRGWPTTNFWARAAKATSWAADPQGVKVSVNQIGVRQRFYGGSISPVNKGALTIPISPLSYGKTVADFPGSFLIRTKKGAYIVQYGNDSGAALPKGEKAKRSPRGHAAPRATLNFLFKLSPGVDQAADPSVLPDLADLAETALDSIREKLSRVTSS